MKRYAAFLRGVMPMNARMAELRQAFESAGFGDVKTVRSSGNVVFSAKPGSDVSLARTAEAAMQQHLGKTFLTIVRSIDALRKILDTDPFGGFRLKPGTKRIVTFLRDPHKSRLKLPITFEDARILAMKGSEVFTVYVPNPRHGPDFMTLLEKTFGKEQTTRTWETIAMVAR
ncbi:MAG: DUF1697 domain-containing protein [Deltaproteobacteria bacterium]|nr:DUF1697 domain-containing protein [Deltaproteobacteria bacterium]